MTKNNQDDSCIRLRGKYFVYLYGPDGILKHTAVGENVVTTGGKEYLAAFLNSAAQGASTFPARYISVGTDATAEAASNTVMGAAVARQTGVASYVSNQIYQVTATFPSGLAVGAIAEYGLFNTNTGGTLFSRDTEAVINVGSSDTLTIVYQLTIS